MRKAKIMTLGRQYRKPPERPLFYRSRKDPRGYLRNLDSPEVLLKRADVVKKFELQPQEPTYDAMTLHQMAMFIGQVGGLPDDDPSRIIDVEPAMSEPSPPRLAPAQPEPEVPPSPEIPKRVRREDSFGGGYDPATDADAPVELAVLELPAPRSVKPKPVAVASGPVKPPEPTTRTDSDGTTHRLADDAVIFTVPYVRRKVEYEGRQLTLRCPAITMYRGHEK